MLAERAVVVGEVLPLVVVARIHTGGKAVLVALSHIVDVVRSAVAMRGVLGDAVTEAGREGETVERHEVGEHRAADVDTGVAAFCAGTLEQRVAGRLLIESGAVVEVVVVARIAEDMIRIRGISGLHLTGQLIDAADVGRGQRIKGDHGVQHGAVAAGNALGGPPFDGVVGTDLQPFLYHVVGVHLSGQALVYIIFTYYHTVIVEVVEGSEEVTVVVAALEGDGVLFAPAGGKHGVIPVVVLAVPVPAGDDFVGKVAESLLHFNITGRIQEFALLAQHLSRHLEVVGNGRVAVLALLGRDEHDTVTGLCTVDGGGSGVLQDLHGLDHGRVEVLDVVNLQTVHDEEGSEVTGVGGITADADLRLGTRSTGVVEDLHTCGLALEGGGGIRGGTVLEVFRTDRSHGTGQVALTLDTVADDHGLLEELGVFFENEVENTLLADGNGLRRITDAGNGKGGSGRDAEGEITVSIRYRTQGAVSYDHDRRAYDRLSAAIDDGSADSAVLAIGQSSCQAHDGRRDDGRQFVEDCSCHKSVTS